MTMQVNAIQSNDRRHSVYAQMIKGAAIGTAGGFVAKYTLPLTPEEMSTDEYIKISNKVKDQKNQFNFRTNKFIQKLKAQTENSLAEKEFIKLFDGMKDGDKVKTSNIRNAMKNLQDNPAELREFKRLCKVTSEIVEKTARQCMNAYDLVTKHIRPTGFFLITGSVVGAMIALINNVLKTEVRQ